jgi:hypothetical protein
VPRQIENARLSDLAVINLNLMSEPQRLRLPRTKARLCQSARSHKPEIFQDIHPRYEL